MEVSHVSIADLDDTKQFGIQLDATAKLIKQDIIRRFRKADIDLTPEQWAILDYLYRKGEVSQRELAEGTFKDPPTVSRIVDLLFSKNLVHRQSDQEDRRRFRISLSKQGNSLYEKSAPIIYEARVKGWQGLSEDDFLQLKRILEKISSNIEA
jgi:DNA-binding MarR family transcriptional regulator